jgi:anti-anti-sigma factor
MGFEANTRSRDGVAVIDLHGDINSEADAALGSAYTEAEANSPSFVLLNFSDVSYINSTGIALIVSILAQARKSGRQILASGLTDHYREIFEITRLADFVKIFPDESSAMATTAG